MISLRCLVFRGSRPTGEKLSVDVPGVVIALSIASVLLLLLLAGVELPLELVLFRLSDRRWRVGLRGVRRLATSAELSCAEGISSSSSRPLG